MYKFIIKDAGGSTMDVSPIYGEDTNLSVTKEGEEMYCRYDLDGKFTFVGKDFDLFYENVFKEYRFELYWSEGGEDTLVIVAPFTFSDMSIDLDNRIAVLDLQGKDQYEEFLNKMDSEYDLVQLAPPRSSVDMFKRAFLQIYVKGDSKLTHILGNTEYEVDASSDAEQKDTQAIESYGFRKIGSSSAISVQNVGVWQPSMGDFWGIYTEVGGKYVSGDGRYVLVPEGQIFQVWTRTDQQPTGFYFYGPTSGYPQEVQNDDSPGTVYGYASVDEREVFGRIVTDSGNHDATIGEGDIWDKNLNYRYYKILTGTMLSDLAQRVVISGSVTDVPNQWMRDDQGRYFVQPKPTVPTQRVIAIGWNQWIPLSYWFRNDYSVGVSLKPYDVKWTLKDAYDLRDAINSLLGKVAPGITVKSDFLDNYGPGYWTNPITDEALWLYITPITNIKRTYYDHAAQRGKITLSQVLNMLRMVFKCYWYLEKEEQGWRLRIEHYSWFDNGGSYVVGEKPVFADFRNDNVALLNKGWMTDQNKFKYDLEEVKSRVSMEWGDKVAELFNQYPIVSQDFPKQGVQADKVDNFTADIDIIESSPEVLSDDMYVLIGADGQKDGVKTIYVGEVGYEPDMEKHPKYLVQNSELTFYSLEQNFHTYGMDSIVSPCTLDGIDLEIKPLTRKRIVRQSVTVPFAIKKPDLCVEKFITGLPVASGGEGAISKIKTNLITQSSEIELLFNDKHIRK